MQAQIAVIDFGSQYTQLIVRRLRELGCFAKLYAPEQLNDHSAIGTPLGVILSGGPSSVSDPNAPDINLDALNRLQVPVLGVCYGMQLLVDRSGGEVRPSDRSEYGPARMHIQQPGNLLQNIAPESQIWMSHSDTVAALPEGCQVLAQNQEGVPVALQFAPDRFGIQFHPEVTHTTEGNTLLRNFLDLTAAVGAFDIQQFKQQLIDNVHQTVGQRKVVCGVSGGVDSSVLAVLLHNANIDTHYIFVDTGLLRHDERAEVEAQFHALGIDIDTVDASQQFFQALDGVDAPEEKRKIIGRLFLDVFFDHAGDFDLFAQGTLYPDVIESATAFSGKRASTIKTHHNRVDHVLELQQQGKVIEPLAELFKDEVRALGEALGMPHHVLYRHPFPGPGLAVRVPGVVTREKVKLLQAADAIFINELKASGWYDKIWQACTTILPTKSVGVKGDERSYEHPVVLRAVISEDAMTADWVEIPFPILRTISNRILNEVRGINRVLYDISTKPPASIEWE